METTRPALDLGKPLTTGQMAAIAKVAPRTVAKWIDAGLLKGYHVPGSLDRRVEPDDFVDFLVAHGMVRRVGSIPSLRRTVLFVGFPADLHARLSTGIGDCAFAANAVEAGMALATKPPRVVVVDAGMGRIDACNVAVAARRAGARTVAIGSLVADCFDATADSAADAPAAVRELTGRAG